MVTPPASASSAMPSDSAYRIVENWAKAFTAADVDGIAALYAPDALMIGTFGKEVLSTPEQIRAYFNVALNTGRPRTARLIGSDYHSGCNAPSGYQSVSKRSGYRFA